MKVSLGDPQVLGQLSFDTPLCGFTLYSGKHDLFGVVWTETESSESTIYSSLPSCSCCHGTYYIALLGSVVISVLICVPIATSVQTRLV